MSSKRTSRSMDRVEIVAVDSKRWACLHLPAGIFLGVLFAVWYFIQERGLDAEMLVEGIVVIVIGIPTVASVVMAAAWLQAELLNNVFRILKKGPILSISTCRSADTEKEPIKQVAKEALGKPKEPHANCS